ncbi:twin-arginine translocase subunit TatB [Wenzhouxiangella sp. XN79A]|uniref:Sec-independent protein translocase protein TatB n=1 Tax=Wenzhouxiangella sp. XN79A TaxID=2724193 RepID=UPI00144A774E|nr:twin-arginine translocase subunit TatB [Wenzhouxiangella sp. XN79A]
MGGVGFTELLLLAVVALIVLGPERLPPMARTAGRLTRQARRAWQSLQSELQSELDADHNRRIMEATAGRDVEPGPEETGARESDAASDRSDASGDSETAPPGKQPGKQPGSAPATRSDMRSDELPSAAGSDDAASDDPVTDRERGPKRDDDAG